MASNPTQQAPTNPWEHQDRSQRLQSLRQLVEQGSLQDYLDILAGNQESGIETAELLAIAGQLPSQSIKQILLITRSRPTAETLVPRLSEGADLMDLCLFARSVHTRKNAALALEDESLLRELLEKVRGKDKTVFKTLDQRLNLAWAGKIETKSQDSTSPASEQPSEASSIAESADSSEAPKVDKQAKADKKPKKVKPTIVDPEKDIGALEAEITKMSFKNTARLNAFRNNLNKLFKQIDETNTDLSGRAQLLHQAIGEKLEKNGEHQQDLQKKTETLLESLKKALEEGQSHDALPAWDKIQGNISNTSGKIRTKLQSQSNEHKAKLNELRDWKIFAATEKKKELIKQMQHLVESRMHASDRSKHIATMHKEWKLLGRSNQNEALWRKFKQFSDKAYEPCKAYFKERKLHMANNLQQRREICNNLEKQVTEIEQENINIAALNKLLSGAETDWKKYAPVEQSKIKTLQKRFYKAINQLRRTRRKTLRENGRQKQELINQAEKLVSLEDKQQAMQEARQLQLSWKKLGPTSYKEDKKYWDNFRKACDKIFEERNQKAAALKQELSKAEATMGAAVKSLQDVFKLDDDAFRSARGEYQDLLQEFSNALNPKIRKQRKNLIDSFNDMKRKVDNRYRTLPDKKRQQLKDSIIEKAKFLENLENQLFNSKNEQQFAEVKTGLDSSSWENFASSGKPEFEQALQARLQQLLKAQSQDELHKLAKQCEQQVRTMCIELEIRADMETPKEDQALRMQIQLAHLKNGFGQLKPDRKENAKYALDTELQSFCIGPLEVSAHQQLSQRLEQAVKKLL
ncbi:MAG: DUF349 domain-containing protein [Gammaproteobacteria bacterium]|jgi:hypothetical protein|nr:DUF349 domain-containing protein [Gammaproteobacteria bacterium]MDP6732995.1 DUF349 domain-containing protein [Gammaproteobacteria bacterium]